jgi:hypothetical protein
MADNTTLNPGVGGDTAAADDIDGVKYQRVKLTLGADGVNDGDVSASNPIPVAESGPLITLFVRLLNMLGAPVGYDKSLGRYRQTTVIETITQGTITAVNTVNNQSNIGGIQAQLLVNGQNLSAWQACVRARIT